MIRLDFNETEIPLLSEGLQSLPYKSVVGLITRLQTQIDKQVRQKVESVEAESSLKDETVDAVTPVTEVV